MLVKSTPTNSLISIVTPCYNQAHYLEETIQSALKSTHRPLEIIIINDGSTDGTKELAEKLSELHPNVKLINQKNQGVSSAINTGIGYAQGEYVIPLAADDLISENYLEAAAKVMDQNLRVKVVYCKAVKFTEKEEKPWKLKPFSINLLARDNMIFATALFRKKDWAACGGYSEDMLAGREDWEFWIKFLKNGGEVVELPFVGFYYRLSPTSKRKKTGTNQKKRERINYLNNHHADFFERELNGPLRFQRTWSKPYNTLLKLIGTLNQILSSPFQNLRK